MTISSAKWKQKQGNIRNSYSASKHENDTLNGDLKHLETIQDQTKVHKW